ncbi:Uncharacterised protein [Rhodococcus coprophilus]|uniref:Uncharacterized protein n=1 Tax=Rhodococcus coprophilus TaxID=38310 RepID=A0A2X4U7S0_9NOCA|nr:Uncharacterised protein [Rhodococcus coprophilus]
MIDCGLDPVYQRGYRVLSDKTGVAAALPTPTGPPTGARPTESEFVSNQREFWFEATQIPIYIARGDLWPAHSRLEGIRSLLLAVLEWHARSSSADPVDTWHNGHIHEAAPGRGVIVDRGFVWKEFCISTISVRSGIHPLPSCDKEFEGCALRSAQKEGRQGGSARPESE